jgi:hypothetical protein
MTPTQQAVLPYLMHLEIPFTSNCLCPAESWAPCGGQYEGRYNPACPDHRSYAARSAGGEHYPSVCPNKAGHNI